MSITVCSPPKEELVDLALQPHGSSRTRPMFLYRAIGLGISSGMKVEGDVEIGVPQRMCGMPGASALVCSNNALNELVAVKSSRGTTPWNQPSVYPMTRGWLSISALFVNSANYSGVVKFF